MMLLEEMEHSYNISKDFIEQHHLLDVTRQSVT